MSINFSLYSRHCRCYIVMNGDSVVFPREELSFVQKVVKLGIILNVLQAPFYAISILPIFPRKYPIVRMFFFLNPWCFFGITEKSEAFTKPLKPGTTWASNSSEGAAVGIVSFLKTFQWLFFPLWDSGSLIVLGVASKCRIHLQIWGSILHDFLIWWDFSSVFSYFGWPIFWPTRLWFAAWVPSTAA